MHQTAGCVFSQPPTWKGNERFCFVSAVRCFLVVGTIKKIIPPKKERVKSGHLHISRRDTHFSFGAPIWSLETH